MIKQIVSATVGVAVWAAIAAEGVRPQAELLVSVEFASFSAFQQKVVDLGTTINNPVVSMMAVPAVQNALTEKFGGFRPDDPMMFLCYGDVSEIRRAIEADSGEMVTKAVYPAFLYPCAEGPQKFLENHPEAQKKADGTIELEDGNVVLFAADGRACAFAKDVASAKRALADATFSKSAARPLIRLEVTEPGVGLLADLHQKLLQEQGKAVQAGTEPVAALIASCMKIQQTMGLVQNAKLRTFARLTMSLDLDATGFVFKGLAPTKSGSSVSPAAGFKLPAGALDALPAGSPLFFAANSWLTCGVQNEGQYRALMNDLCGVLDSIASCSREGSPKCAETVKGLCSAGSVMLKTVPTPAPTDWFVGALGFGLQQEPYLVVNGTCAQAPQSLEAGSRFYASVAAIVEKSWPGILRAQDASLTVNWFRLVDVVTEAVGNTPKDREEAEKVKQGVAAVVGGSESVIGSKLTSQTSYRSYFGAKGLTPSLSSCESRLAAVLPEVGADRPSGVFYLSLYSLARDNMLPIAVKVLPQKEKEELQAIQAVLPPAGANGALAGASWEDKNGTRWLFRVTKDEIKNIAAAVNAAMAAQVEK